MVVGRFEGDQGRGVSSSSGIEVGVLGRLLGTIIPGRATFSSSIPNPSASFEADEKIPGFLYSFTPIGGAVQPLPGATLPPPTVLQFALVLRWTGEVDEAEFPPSSPQAESSIGGESKRGEGSPRIPRGGDGPAESFGDPCAEEL